MAKTKKKCHCTATLLADGTCPHPGCTPELRAPTRRAMSHDAAERARMRERRGPNFVGLLVTPAEVQRAALENMPTHAEYCLRRSPLRRKRAGIRPRPPVGREQSS